MARKKSVTLPQLAEKLGLSVYTVSKALRGLPGMSEKTRQEVIKLANEMGYLTKDQESSLIYEGIPRLSIKQRRFLMVTTSRYSTTIQQVFMGIKERLLELGHKVDLIFLPETLRIDQFGEWVEQEGVMYADGLFLAPLLPEPLEEKLLELKLPRILINYPPVGGKVDSVIWDVYDATLQSVRFLLANGHRDILCVGDTLKTRGYKQRWLAFEEGMRQAGIRVEEETHRIHIKPGDDQWKEKLQLALEKLRPTALLYSAHDMNLSWVFYACSDSGRQIPRDISIIILDYIRDGIIPDITRPILLMSETGYRAADRMLWRMANSHLPYEHIRLQGSFFEGRTVRNLNEQIVP